MKAQSLENRFLQERLKKTKLVSGHFNGQKMLFEYLKNDVKTMCLFRDI